MSEEIRTTIGQYTKRMTLHEFIMEWYKIHGYRNYPKEGTLDYDIYMEKFKREVGIELK